MKHYILGFAAVALLALAASAPAEAKKHHKHDRIYIAQHDVIYLRGAPYHRHHRAPVYVVRDRYGYPLSYYIVNNDRYYDDDYAYRHRDYYRHHDNRYRYSYRDRDRDGITIIYRNR
jgi:hypothetical protein